MHKDNEPHQKGNVVTDYQRDHVSSLVSGQLFHILVLSSEAQSPFAETAIYCPGSLWVVR